MSEPIIIYDDDGPDGETVHMQLEAGGNGDWYMQIIGKTWTGERLVSDGFRASTSGSKCGLVTSCVALLAAIGSGKRSWARSIAKGIVYDLERGLTQLPNEPDEERNAVARRHAEAMSRSEFMRGGRS